MLSPLFSLLNAAVLYFGEQLGIGYAIVKIDSDNDHKQPQSKEAQSDLVPFDSTEIQRLQQLEQEVTPLSNIANRTLATCERLERLVVIAVSSPSVADATSQDIGRDILERLTSLENEIQQDRLQQLHPEEIQDFLNNF